MRHQTGEVASRVGLRNVDRCHTGDDTPIFAPATKTGCRGARFRLPDFVDPVLYLDASANRRAPPLEPVMNFV
jgi:hypothetical protein